MTAAHGLALDLHAARRILVLREDKIDRDGAYVRALEAKVSRLTGEVERLRALSESQAQALDMMEAGRL